ncbi:hypothetical protein MASR2M79_07460 [Aminivibrio sp.]
MGVHVEVDEPFARTVDDFDPLGSLHFVHVPYWDVLDDVHFSREKGRRAGRRVADGADGDLLDRRCAPSRIRWPSW